MNFEKAWIHFLRDFSLSSLLLLEFPISARKQWIQILLTISEEWTCFIPDYGDQGIVVDEPPSTDELLETVLELLPVHGYMIAVSVANNLRYEWILVDFQNDTMTALPEVLPIGKVFLIFLLSVWGN